MEPKRLTDADLRAIRARVEAVVRGNDERWEWREDELLALWDDDHCQPVLNDSPEYGPRLPADAEFIAHARADIPALLAHADALAAENDALREDHSRLQVVLWTLLNELSPGVVEELRAVWGNTNTRILEDRIEDARRALDDAP